MFESSKAFDAEREDLYREAAWVPPPKELRMMAAELSMEKGISDTCFDVLMKRLQHYWNEKVREKIFPAPSIDDETYIRMEIENIKHASPAATKKLREKIAYEAKINNRKYYETIYRYGEGDRRRKEVQSDPS